MLLFYKLPWWDFSEVAMHPWMSALGEIKSVPPCSLPRFPH
jgi:hypothetical protein